MPQEDGKDGNSNGSSSTSVDQANEGTEQQSAEETHQELMGDPVEEAGLVSTTEFLKPVEEDESSGDGKPDSDSSDEGEGKDKDKKKVGELTEKDIAELDATFQQSPRFQKLLEQKNEAKAEAVQAAATVQALTEQVSTLTDLVKGLGGNQKSADKQQSAGYQDVLQLNDEQIIENFEANPKGFLANFAQQIHAELSNSLTKQYEQKTQNDQKAAQEQAVRDLYAQYEKDNPDFVDLWNKGEIQKFMNANPGNTPISAHKIMAAESIKANQEEAQQKAIEAAVKAALEEAGQKAKTKQSVKVLPGGPGGGVQKSKGTPTELLDTKKHGGLFSVLTQRSLAREKQGQS